jgi:hypothetical protein
MIANGRPVDVSNLLALDKAIEELRETIRKAEPIQVSVLFVEGSEIECPSCAHRFNPHTLKPVERQPFRFRCKCGASSEISTTGPFTDGGDPGKPIAAPEPAATPNGVTYREGVSGSAFHAAVLRNNEIPPLKKEQPAIGAHVSPGDTVAGLWCNDRHPYRNRDVAHQLPAVNGKG